MILFPKGTTSYAFYAWALRATSQDTPARRLLTTVFYLEPMQGNPRLSFPCLGHWLQIVGFKHELYTGRLKALGCVQGGRDYVALDLKKHNDPETFEQLYTILQDIVRDMEQTLAAERKKGAFVGQLCTGAQRRGARVRVADQ
jgi:hypothetical protein